jgi:hypothetical protein
MQLSRNVLSKHLKYSKMHLIFISFDWLQMLRTFWSNVQFLCPLTLQTSQRTMVKDLRKIVSSRTLDTPGKSYHLKRNQTPSPRLKHTILRSYIDWRFFVVAALLIKPKQQHGKNQNCFVYKLYGFCCHAYQNKQKKIVIFFICLGLS